MPSPNRSQAGVTSSSTERSSREYSFCTDTNDASPAVDEVQEASATCQPSKLEHPT